jgi:hypothetical protein
MPNRGQGRLVNSRELLPFAGEPSSEFRERMARQQAATLERRQQALIEQSSTLNTPQERIRIWEQLHAITLPRDAAHRLIGVIAAQTGLTTAQIREEQQQRAAAPAAAKAAASAPATGIQDVPS